MLKRSSLITSANMTSAKNCEVYAFVLATPEYCDGEGFLCDWDGYNAHFYA